MEWLNSLDYANPVAAPPKVVTVKNFLVCAGIYYLTHWMALPLAFAFGKLTQGIIYHGDFQGAVIAPLVLHLNIALVAALAGASIIWLIDSPRPLNWVLLVALLYVFFGFFGYHWAHAPTIHDRVFETVGALFPGITCFLGGIVASRWRSPSHAPSSD